MKITIQPAELTLPPIHVSGANVEAVVSDNGALVVTVKNADGHPTGGVIIGPHLWYKAEIVEPMDPAVREAIREGQKLSRRMHRP